MLRLSRRGLETGHSGTAPALDPTWEGLRVKSPRSTQPYVWTLEGWMYLAFVMDLFSRRIVGWAMDKRIKAHLTIDALAMAYWMRKPAKGLVHHSDRGSQYACHEYQNCLDAYGMIPIMSRKR